jgi:co-chaperonin GroES (HSP10)
MFEPNGTRLLLQDRRIDYKEGSIIVPETAKKRRFEVEAEVLAVGPDCKVYKAGDIVLLHVNDGLKITLGREEYRLWSEEKVLGRVTP